MVALLLIAAAVALVVLVVLEERGRPDLAVLVAVGATVADALLYAHQQDVPIGPFRPAFGGQDLRVVDVVVPAAIGARLLVRGFPRRATTEGLLWTLFFAWYAFAGVVGFVREQPIDLILFQGKLVLETGGLMLLVAGVPLHRLVEPALVRRVALIFGGASVLLVPMAAAGVSVDVPFLHGAKLGVIGPDAATMLFTLGVLVLVVTACRAQPTGGVLVCGGAMLLAPFMADQRAALVGAVPAVLAVAMAVAGPVWRRRSRVRVAALLPVLAVALLPIGVAALRSASAGEGVAAVPLVDRLEDTFVSQQKQESADIRVGLLREGRELTSSRPVLGQGLGQPVAIFNGSGTDAAISIGDFHDIAVDLAVRTGLPGLVLFAAAVVVSLLAAAHRWRVLLDDAQAALVLAAGAALAGLVVKGLFETIFQKYRLAVVLGLLLGIVASAATARQVEDERAITREPAWT